MGSPWHRGRRRRSGLALRALLFVGAGLTAARAPAYACPEGQGLVAAAHGLERLSRGAVKEAVRCLERAAQDLPESAAIARDLGLAYAQAGRLAEARAHLRAALDLGDPGVELALAVLEAEAGRPEEARRWARAAGGVEGLTIAAALDDPEAIRALAPALEGEGPATPAVRIVLARAAAARGDVGAAEVLAASAERAAEAAGDALALNAARAISLKVADAPRLRVAGSARVDLGAVGNPGWSSLELARGRRAWAAGARGQLLGELRVGGLAWRAGLRIDQLLFLEDRDALADVEWTGLEATTAVEIPFSDDLRAATLDIGIRATEVRADGLSRHLATGIEGGPRLSISIAPRWWGELGVSGVWTDFEEPSEASFDRDRVGQRARLALRYEDLGFEGVVEATALNDEAEGQAFDALGATLGVGASIWATSRLRLDGGLRLALRRWGPIGDEAVIGEAARRRDLRLAGELGVTWQIAQVARIFARSSLVRVDARRGHAYAADRHRVGLEAGW